MNIRDWSIQPNNGLRYMKFGSSTEEISLVTIYGDTLAKSNSNIDLDVARETLEMFGGGLSDQEKEEFIKSVENSNSQFSDHEKHILSTGLQLHFTNNRLNSIIGDQNATALNYNGYYFFQSDSLPALLKLQNDNEEPPLVYESDIWFDKINVQLYGFLEKKIGNIRRINLEKEKNGDRTISWSHERLISDDIFDKYEPMLIPTDI